MKKLVLALLFLSSPAWALMKTATSSPDISISATTSKDFQFPGRPSVNWVSIKNDCSTQLHFNLNPKSRSASDYPLRLNPGESFTTPVDVSISTISVSNDGSAACTFTLQGMYE